MRHGSIRIPRPVARATVAAALRPILSPRVPIRLQRRLLDLNRHTLPLPSGTRRRRTVLGGVPAERLEHPGAAAGRTVLYLHGGGYIVGSTDSHRAVAAQLSRTARAPVHVLDYRLAPDHPYPAAVTTGRGGCASTAARIRQLDLADHRAAPRCAESDRR